MCALNAREVLLPEDIIQLPSKEHEICLEGDLLTHSSAMCVGVRLQALFHHCIHHAHHHLIVPPPVYQLKNGLIGSECWDPRAVFCHEFDLNSMVEGSRGSDITSARVEDATKWMFKRGVT